MKGKRLNMKLFGNSSGSKHASSGGRHVSSAKPVKQTKTENIEKGGYSREEAQQYARKMSEQNAGYAEAASGNSSKGAKHLKKKKRGIRALIIV